MAHNKRTGIPSLMALAKELCRLITKFGSIIRAVSNNDPSVALALETALTACAALEEKLAELAEPGV